MNDSEKDTKSEGTSNQAEGVSVLTKQVLTLDAPQLTAAMEPFRAFGDISGSMGHKELKAAAQRHPASLSVLFSGASRA